ncbi:hypothetical protein V6N13_032979 [Hibiscus sabdariffa]
MPIITMPFGHTGDYTIYQENYNLSRDLKSFLFHATDKNLAYVSPRFLLGSQSFVMDASERSKFIVNLEVLLQQHAIDETDFFYYISELSRHSLKQWMVKPTVQKDTVFSAILYYKRNSYQCPGDIIRFCNNAFKHCNDHLRNTGVLGHHKKDIESRLSIAFPFRFDCCTRPFWNGKASQAGSKSNYQMRVELCINHSRFLTHGFIHTETCFPRFMAMLVWKVLL